MKQRRRAARPIRHARPSTSGTLATPTDWRTGLKALSHFRRCFPELAALIEGWPVTPAVLTRVCEVLMGLVDARVGPLISLGEDAETNALHEDPTEYLLQPIDPQLIRLDSFVDCMEKLIPEGYGFGLALFFDGEDWEPPSLLDLALWRLFQDTEWSSGLEINELVAEHRDGQFVLDLQPLSPLTDMEEFQARVDTLPVWPYQAPLAELIAYPVEQTTNQLANIQNGLSWDGYWMQLEWEELPDIFGRVREAQTISRAYRLWSDAIEYGPDKLVELAEHLHSVAASCCRRSGMTLMEILGDDEQP